MGLDMYLYLEDYQSRSSWGGKDYKRFYPSNLNVFAEEIYNRNFMSKNIRYQIGYWRKANAIHKWFVDNVMQGEDDCTLRYVDTDKLKELSSLVNDVLNDHSLAKTLLPTEEGFFFGSQSYDEWYFKHLEYTKRLLDNLIPFLEKNNAKNKFYDVIYQASW